MGFDCTLVMLYPETRNETVHPVWTAHETLALGRVTRMEKLTAPRFRHLTYGARKRAAICSVSILLSRLFATLDEAPRKVLAPAILPQLAGETDFELHFQRLEARLKALEAAEGPTVDLGSADALRIRSDVIPKHNAAIRLDDAALALHVENHHPVTDPPLLWLPCNGLADALDEAEAAGSEEWSELEKDSLALALTRARRSYLREVGTVGTHALFTFPGQP